MSTITVPQALELALQHHRAGRLAEAEAGYREVLATEPSHAGAWHHLGMIAVQKGRGDLAVEWIQHAIVLDPKNAAAHSNLGLALAGLGRLDEAVDAYHWALQLQPDSPQAWLNLGNAEKERGRHEDAVIAFRRALQLKPDYAGAWNNLGVALNERGQIDGAVGALQQAIRFESENGVAYCNLGNALKNQGQLDEALAAYRRALELPPVDAECHRYLGYALKDLGRLDEAIAEYRRALERNPKNAGIQSDLIYALHFHPGSSPGEIAAEQQRWNRQFAEPVRQFVVPSTHDRDPGRRLRIGYVSPDFWGHVIGRNVWPLFEHHDDERFEIFCYAGVTWPDEWTERFRKCAGKWRSTVGVPDEALAAMIRSDGVDILVDLSQHLPGNRLPVFARRPAPVRVSFAGYPETTGLEAIEYRISDRYLEAEPREAVFLLDSFWCYDPGGMEVKVNALPAQSCGHVTFGSLNNFCKINEATIRLWGRVLAQVEDSRLVLMCPAGERRRWILEVLEREGIAAHCVEFAGRLARRDFLELHHRLDIVLDPFPYHGHTTSLDALWMGVPVISRVGKPSVSRAGLSQLSNVGLADLAAFSEEDYVRIATRLARDLPRLAELRATLRARMETGPLMDSPRFARSIETAYRTMWQRWCAEKPHARK